MNWDWGDSLSGAVSGGITGGMASGWNPYVMGASAVAGGAYGGYSGGKRNAATKKRKASMDQAMAEMRALSAKQSAQRLADMDKIMAYYKPAEDILMERFGGGPQVPIMGQRTRNPIG